MSINNFERSAYGGRPEEFYVFQVVGGPRYTYTSSRLPITHLGVEYTPKVMERGNYTYKKEVSGEDALKIEVQADLDILDQFKIIVPRRATLVAIYRRHRGDPDNEAQVIFRGRIRGVSRGTAKATIECDSMAAMTKRGGLTLNYQVPCNYFVYSTGCGLNKGDFAIPGFLTGISADGLTLTSPYFATQADQWLKYGFLEIGDGAYTIINHVGDQIRLLNGLEGVTITDPFVAYAGCDRRQETCWTKFKNGLNHLGFKWSPAENVFETGI